jgi:hypothetical protein
MRTVQKEQLAHLPRPKKGDIFRTISCTQQFRCVGFKKFGKNTVVVGVTPINGEPTHKIEQLIENTTTQLDF